VYCSVLQCVMYSDTIHTIVLQGLLYVPLFNHHVGVTYNPMLKYVTLAVCCIVYRVLLCVAVCCSLQYCVEVEYIGIRDTR